MSSLDFKLYQKPEFDADTSYIQLQVGKGKRKQPSVYIDYDAFACIRGVIWNKHREFGTRKKTQINNDDWRRILEGFEEAVVELEAITDSEELIDILSIPSHLDSEIDTIFEHKNELQQLLTEMVNWVKTNLKKEKYILIIQHD